MTPAISQFDLRYIHRNAAQLDPDWLDFDDMGPAFRIEVQAALGMATHHARCRIKSTEYDWRRIDAWMTEHRMSNSNFAYLLGVSVGTIANIRSGHYTGAPMIERILSIINGCE